MTSEENRTKPSGDSGGRVPHLSFIDDEKCSTDDETTCENLLWIRCCFLPAQPQSGVRRTNTAVLVWGYQGADPETKI